MNKRLLMLLVVFLIILTGSSYKLNKRELYTTNTCLLKPLEVDLTALELDRKRAYKKFIRGVYA